MLVMAFNGQAGPSGPRKTKVTPPDETSEEAAYLKGLGEKQKPVSIKLADGEVVHGWIEYYDRNMVRLTRETGPICLYLSTKSCTSRKTEKHQ